MQKPLAVAIWAMLVSPAVLAIGQATTPAPAAATAPAAPVSASTLLQPSINSVVTVLNSLKIDKWKKGSVREEAGQNVNSILQDIQNNLPPLIGAADAAPGSVSAAMPLVKHLDALYDVLLRVEEASRIAAPSEQISQLQDALTVFGRVPHPLGSEAAQWVGNHDPRPTNHDPRSKNSLRFRQFLIA